MGPNIVTPPRDVRSPVGSNIQLECNAIGHPVPTITWYKANSLLLPFQNTRYVFLRNGNLQIFEVEFSDRGLFECIAENSAGSTNAYITISVVPATGKIILNDEVTIYLEGNSEAVCFG